MSGPSVQVRGACLWNGQHATELWRGSCNLLVGEEKPWSPSHVWMLPLLTTGLSVAKGSTLHPWYVASCKGALVVISNGRSDFVSKEVSISGVFLCQDKASLSP